jgi:glycerophosphoryl diester phosphodiesterase
MRLFKLKYRAMMAAHNRILLLIDVTYKVLFIIFLFPAFHLALSGVMKLWGRSYVTDGNLVSFLTYPPTLLLILISLFVYGFYTLLKITTMLQYSFADRNNPHPDIPKLLLTGFLKACRLLRSGRLLLLLYALMLLLLVNLPILTGITVYFRFPADFWNGSADRLFIKGLILAAMVFLGFITFQSTFALNCCLRGNLKVTDGIRLSKKLLRGHTFKLAARLLFYNLILSLCIYLTYYLVLTVSALCVYLFADRYMVITVFLALYPKINFYTVIIAGSIAFVFNLNVLTTRYLTLLPKADPEYLLSDPGPSPDRSHDIPLSLTSGKYRHLTVSATLLFFIFGFLNLYQSIRNDSFYLQGALSGISISSHRGNSLLAPENTLASLQSAIEARSDYAEIDIQQAGDGTLVLLHDQSLWRTTGLNKELKYLTLEELKQLDAGSWFGGEFLYTPIPTLEEALRFCKGKIRLNIDIKVYGGEKQLEETLADLIEQYDYEHQCIISSTDYRVLVRVKSISPELKTGLILSAAYGNFYGNDFIDFYSIRSAFITKSIVESAHRYGKEIQAWTVNKTGELERMKSLGVDCIITDNPIHAREVLYRDDTNETFIELLNHMLKHRSFYQLVRGGYSP